MLRICAIRAFSICLFVMLLGIALRGDADDGLASLQSVSASRLRSGLPDEPFAAWMKGVVGEGAKIIWSGPYDCEESAGPCFEAGAEIGDCGKAVVRVAVLRTDVDVEEKFRIEMIYVEGLGPTVWFTDLATLQARLEEAKRLDQELRAKPLRPIDDTEAVAYVKALDVKQLDEGLSSRPLAEWFEDLAGSGSAISWRLMGCGGGGAGLLDAKGCADVSACVVGNFNNPQESVWVTVEVGSYRRGIFGAPEFFGAQLYNNRRGRPGSGKYPLRKLPVVLQEIRN